MEKQLKQLESDIKSMKKSQVDGDQFSEKMNISFSRPLVVT
jgi:hypothetical protein